MAKPLGVEEVAQQEFVAVHTVEESHVDRSAEQLLWIVRGEKIVALHLV